MQDNLTIQNNYSDIPRRGLLLSHPDSSNALQRHKSEF